jgi:hypothetical protein
LQEKINKASSAADVLLLGYGLCGMAAVGLQAITATLVIPRVDDCIAFLLGSRAARQIRIEKEPGTYFLTKSYIEAGITVFSDYQRLVERRGSVKARRMIGLVLKNYTRLCFITSPRGEAEHYRDYARRMAAEFHLSYEQIVGTPTLAKRLVLGPWNEEFVVIPRGRTLTFEMFNRSG